MPINGKTLSMPVVPASWRPAITVALLVVTAATLIANTLVDVPVDSPQPIDYSVFGDPGARLLTGQWSGIFADRTIQAGVFELAFWGVAFVLGVYGGTEWIVFCLVAGALLGVVTAWLVERLLRPLTPFWSVPLALVVTAFCSATGIITTAITVGHPAELAVPLMWIGAAMLARRDRPLAAAALVAATAGWELWGLLGIPLLLLAPRIDVRLVWRSAAVGVLVVAALYLPFVLLGPFNMFAYGWRVRDNSLASLFISSGERFPWPLRIAQGVLAMGGGTLVALLARRRTEAIWLLPLVVCAIRLVADPVLAPYYSAPPLLLCLVGITMAIAQRSVPIFVACLVMINVLSDARLSLLTACLLLLGVVVTTVIVARSAQRSDEDSSTSERPVTTYDGGHGGS